MNFFKKNIRTIIGFVVGVILSNSIAVYAYSYISSDIKYTKKDGTEISVAEALNYLYGKLDNNLSYEIIYQKDETSSANISYTIKEEDTNYKSIMVVVSAVNIAGNDSVAFVQIANENILPIYDPSEIEYSEYNLNVSNDIYVGVINNPIKDDIITIGTFYASRILILGIK